jgi:hypothetical protein
MNRIFWLLVLAVCVALSANYARGGEVSLMAGATRFGAPSDGTYHNVNQPSDFSGLTQPSVGVRWDSTRLPFNTSVGVQYTYFGTARTAAMAVSNDAPELGGYIPNSGGYCVGTCAPIYRWVMESEAQSVAFIAAKHFGNFSIEWGVNFYETKTRGYVDYGTGIYNYPNGKHTSSSEVFGLGYKYGPLSVRLQMWLMNGPSRKGSDGREEAPAIFNDEKTYSLLVGYTF